MQVALTESQNSGRGAPLAGVSGRVRAQISTRVSTQVRAWLQREAQAARATGAPAPNIEAIMKLLGF